MDYFKKINEKLDIGWKYTDCECPSCKKQAFFNPKDETFHCISCEKILDFQRDKSKEESPEKAKEQVPISQDAVEFEENYKRMKSERNQKKDDASSKLAQKLLEGWAMLEECCPNCMVPLMKPKKGSAICVSCDYQWEKEKPSSEKEKDKAKEEKKNDKEKNLDKPRQIAVSKQESHNRENWMKQEIVAENINNMLVGLSKLYKEKVEKICMEGTIEAAEAFVKGPLGDLIEVQGKFVEICGKIRPVEK